MMGCGGPQQTLPIPIQSNPIIWPNFRRSPHCLWVQETYLRLDQFDAALITWILNLNLNLNQPSWWSFTVISKITILNKVIYNLTVSLTKLLHGPIKLPNIASFSFDYFSLACIFNSFASGAAEQSKIRNTSILHPAGCDCAIFPRKTRHFLVW